MCLVHDFGKGLTPRDKLPAHIGHDINGVKVAKEFLERLKAPAKMINHAEKCTRYHMAGHRLNQMNPKTFVKMFDELNILNDPDITILLYRVFCCDHRGRLGSETESIDHLTIFLDYANAYKSVKFADVFPNGENNPNKIKDGMMTARIQAVKTVKEHKDDY